MGDPPLDSQPGIVQIKGYLSGQNVTTLWDISEWNTDNSTTWKDWYIPICPPHPQNEKATLLSLLLGKSPISKKIKDIRGWGNRTGVYSTSASYKCIKSSPHIPDNPAIWKSIW